MAANDQEIWVSAFDVLIAQLDEALIELRRSLASVAIEGSAHETEKIVR